MFSMHYREVFRNLSLLKKNRHPFKSGEKYFISLEKEKKRFKGKNISPEELIKYRKKLIKRLRRERLILLLKIISALILIFLLIALVVL